MPTLSCSISSKKTATKLSWKTGTKNSYKLFIFSSKFKITWNYFLNVYLLNQGAICLTFEKHLEQACVEFPRFYFLDREELITALGHIRDCRKYLPAVKMCFSGVQELICALPPNVVSENTSPRHKQSTQLAFDINGEFARKKFLPFGDLKWQYALFTYGDTGLKIT